MMKKFLFVFLALFIGANISWSEDIAHSLLQEKWECHGYCFLGGDCPTNPWQPVSSSGSSEQEARDNIDCGSFEEANITCEKVSK
jgi:hypothetical protein